MSFCPHCGKSVAEQAAKCIACGGELQPRGKGARFKGTMMMQPSTASGATPAPMPAPAPAPVPPVAKPPVAAAPAAPRPEAQRSVAAAPSKAKHTMIGTGIGGGLAGMGIAPPPGVGKPQLGRPTAASVPPGAPPPAAGPSSLPPAPPPSPPPAPDPALADTGRNPTPVPAWDPVADTEAPPPASPKHSAPRLDPESDPPSPQMVPGRSKGGPIVALAIVGLMLLLALCYLIARFLGFA